MRLRFASGLPTLVASIVLVGASFAGEPVKSGQAAGEPVSPFDVEDITGPNQGKTLCYR
ncbi:MAG: hypothetical protein U0800_12135 [Isosphaeraceae bacterium]